MLHRLATEINNILDSKENMELAKTNYEVVVEIGKTIGLFDLDPQLVLTEVKTLEAKNRKLDLSDIEKLVSERHKLRNAKDYIAADEITKRLRDCGIKLIDNDNTTKWEFTL